MKDLNHLNILNQSILKCINYFITLPKELSILAILVFTLGATLVLNLIFQIILRHLESRYQHKNKPLKNAVVKELKKPLKALIFLSGILWAVEILLEYYGNGINYNPFVIWSNGLLIICGWFLLRLTSAMEAYFLNNNSNIDSITILTTGRISRLIIIILLLLMVMENCGLSISGLLAFGGVGGIAIGFAARDLLANFFGGFMLFIDRPFSVGDWIRSPDRNIEGVVEKIGWRMTCIRTFELRPLYVPNSIFINISVENPSRMLHRRIYEHIGIRYSDMPNVEKIVAEIKDMLYNHPEIENKQVIIVSFSEFGDSALQIMVYAFTKTTKWVYFYEVKQKILLLIKDIVNKYGADFAFPTQQLFVTQTPNEPEDLPTPKVNS